METNKISYITIQQYLDGSLDKEVMHELEKRALDDPFLADALEGYSNSSKPAAKQLSLLQTQLEERIARQQDNKNVFNFSWQRLSVAAAAGLLFITASILFWIKGQKTEEQIASNPKQVEVNLTPADSMDADGSAQKQIPAPAQSLSEKDIAGRRNQDTQIAGLNRQSSQPELAQTAALSTPDKSKAVDYGVQKKVSVTASAPAADARQLQGRVANNSTVSKSISGQVVSKNGEPLSGALVTLKNSGIATITDANGQFSLNDSIGGIMNIAFMGFNSREINAKPGIPLTIALDENPGMLNEVAIVGYGTSTKEFPEPVTGWSRYNEYLQNSIRSSASQLPAGKVVVTFRVGADNRLSDFKIKKGLDEKRNQEAIRLIKEGPAWNKGKQAEANVTISFK